MSKTVKELYSEAAELDERQRADLAGLLLESLEPDQDPDVENAWKAEIEKRLAQIDAGETELIPWDSVKQAMYDRVSEERS